MNSKPQLKPINPFFSSGPCAKRPGWNPSVLKEAILGRSHRSKIALNRINEVVELTREILKIPQNYKIAVVPASDTGAIEMVLWSLLGKIPIDILAWESFGKDWVKDVIEQLKIPSVRVLSEEYGKIPDLRIVDFKKDVIFTWNGTTSGVCVPNGEWISDDRQGLTICDATSAAFSMHLPWEKLDVTTYSWQKVLGGEAQHGIIILGPRAVQRVEQFTPDRAIPKIFKLTSKGKLNEKMFMGNTINTPSMLCFEDVLDSLKWVKKIGGLDKTIEISNQNLKVVEEKISKIQSLEFLAKDQKFRSCTSICLKIKDEVYNEVSKEVVENRLKKLLSFFEEEDIAYDINSYRDAPLGIRIWGGATVSNEDISKLMDWLKWGFEKYFNKESI
tara:strand:- start:1059 stop:2222 length:1164 start_codon:yes stop_codon:yes gene_type:complete